jgi:hypothetical protein
MQIGYLMWMSCMSRVDMFSLLADCCFMEVIQTDNLNEVYMEVELAALDTATMEADWLRELLMDLPIVEKPLPTILMNFDNQMVIVKLDSSKDNMKLSRHIKRRLKSIRKMRNSGVITLDYIHTEKNLADPFTKGLSRNVIDVASKEMDLRPT